MVATLVMPTNETLPLELLRPPVLPGGTEPEQRIIVCGVSWRAYLKFDKKLGQDRSGPRLYFLDGDLEIMSTSEEHERVKKWIGGFVEDYLLDAGLDATTRGQATMRALVKKAGAEPDDSWCIDQAKKHPDIVLEVALTTGLNKLEIYKRMGVREVWFWRRKKLEIFALGQAGEYERVERSRIVPKLDPGLIERCLGCETWRGARLAFRAGLSRKR